MQWCHISFILVLSLIVVDFSSGLSVNSYHEESKEDFAKTLLSVIAVNIYF